MKNKISIKCKTCCKQFEVTQSLARRKYCSIQCYRDNRKHKLINNGYVIVKKNDSWIYQHRYVFAKHIGRELLSKEVIHHIDHDPLNNDIDNLELLSIVDHVRRHHLGLKDDSKYVTKQCPICDVDFNRRKKLIERYKTSYCSAKCHYNSRSITAHN